MGDLNKQRSLLKHLGISDDEEDPRVTAGNAVTGIIRTGYFGFLHGLAANAYQIWAFAVCLYVTVGVAVIHFFPINAMPAGFTFANGFTRIKKAWQRWRFRQRQWYDATGKTFGERRLNRNWSRQNRSLRDPNRYTAHAVPHPQNSMALQALEGLNGATAPRMGGPQARVANYLAGDCQKAAHFYHEIDEIQPFRVNASSADATVTVLIDGIQVCALLDSGSNLTILPQRIARLLKMELKKDL